MRKSGITILIIGLLGLIFTLNLDTTVSTYSGRVHNIGLMNDKNNFLILFISMIMAGLFLFYKNKTPSSKTQLTRICPYCAEEIKVQAIVCRHCSRNVDPVSETEIKRLVTSSSETIIERVNFKLTLLEKIILAKYGAIKNLEYIKYIYNKFFLMLCFLDKNIKSISVFMIALGVSFFLYFEIVNAVFEMRRTNLGRISDIISISPLVISGLIFIWGRKLQKNDDTITEPTIKSDDLKERFIIFFKRKIDLKYCQIILLFLITFFHFYYNNYDCYYLSLNDAIYYHKISYFLSILLTIFGYLLYKSNDKLYGGATIALGVIYLIFRYLLFTEYECDLQQQVAATNKRILYNSYSDNTFDFSEYLWIIILSSVVPYFQLIKLKFLRFGQIHGDLRFKFIGNEILIPFGSAFVFLVIWKGIFLIDEAMMSILMELFNLAS